MAFWDGTAWVPEPDSSPPTSSGRSSLRPAFHAGLIALLILALGASSVLAAPKSKYPGTLTATPNVLQAGDYFDVTGCGYDASLGNVWLTFAGGSWGSPLGYYGCFTITRIPALSGDTLPPGTYDVKALQLVGKKWKVTGQTTVTVVP